MVRVCQWMVGALLALVMLGWGTPPLHAQAPPADNVRGLVQTYLYEQLGYEPALIQFTFQGRTWESSALGCPQDGQNDTEEQIAGYQWFFLMGDGIRYALHSDVFGSQIILCPQTSEPMLTYSTYNSTFFAIQHPNSWTARQVTPNEFHFNFQGQSTCALPEMRVLVTANYSDAASLLDAYFSGLGFATDRNDYVPILEGLTAQHTLNCGSITRQYQATAVISGTTNASYLLLQSTSATVFDIWSGPFVEMLNSLVIGTSPVAGAGAPLGTSVQPDAPTQAPTSTPAEAPPVAPPTPTPIVNTPESVAAITAPSPVPTHTATPVPTQPLPPPVVNIDLGTVPLAHLFLDDLYIGRTNSLPGIRVSRSPSQRQGLRISADGQQIAFIDAAGTLYTTSLMAPTNPNRLADDVAYGFPPAWGIEQASLSYIRQANNQDEAESNTLEIVTIAPDASTQTNGTFTFTTTDDCQAQTNYRIDTLYWAATGINGDGLMFQGLPNNRFLISTRCDGGGLVILDANSGDTTPLDANLRRATLSPNRETLAALDAEQALWVVDLVSGESRNLPTQHPPDQLRWDITSTQIFYSSLFAQDPLTFDDEARQAEAEASLGAFPFESRLNTVQIFQIDTNNQLEVRLWEGTGFAVGTLAASPDGKGLLFTLIPSDRSLLTNFINQVDARVLRNSQPTPELYWLPSITMEQTEPGSAQLLAFSSQPRFGVPPPQTDMSNP